MENHSCENQAQIRTGVYICHCGGNISDVVDVKKTGCNVSGYPGVSTVRDYPFMCSAPGQELIKEDIRNNGINRVVVAACSPALHENTFRRVLQSAGLNPYLYEHVNIREGVSWVHKSQKEGASQKAATLIKAGVEKVMRQDPLKSIQVHAERRAAVIGAGISGMKAALSIAGRGIEVSLIERECELGGRLREFGTVFPHGEDAASLREELVRRVREENRITVHMASEVNAIDGYVGNFDISLMGRDGSIKSLKAGVLILATGFSHYAPSRGEYGYGERDNIFTMPEFLKMLRRQPDRGALIHKGREIKSIAFIHCVGSRQIEGIHTPGESGKLNEHCSRVCCTTTLHTIGNLLNRYPGLEVYDFYRDIRTYGRGHEAFYESASKKGALFFRFAEDSPPEIVTENGEHPHRIRVRDLLTWGEEVEIRADAVVLATGMIPSPIEGLVDMLKLPLGSDGFLQEAHPKLRPVEVASTGIFLAGACQAPMNLCESSSAAGAAAAKAAILLSSPEISLDPYVASVNEELCTGCSLCLDECSYSGALAKSDEGHIQVNAALCKGCGACAAVCEPRAINLAGWTLDQFDAMVEVIAAGGRNG